MGHIGIALLASTLVWFMIVSPLVRSIPNSSVSLRGPVSLTSLLAFTRPHTIKGTTLATIAGYILLSVYHDSRADASLARILISGILANVFIVGVNQLVDVEIDRVNKKPLPIADNTLSWGVAHFVCALTFIGSITIGFAESSVWGTTIALMCTIGVLYSVPPFRLKRFAVPAALCIVSARALLATIGGTLAFTQAMDKSIDSFTLFHLKSFTCILIAFTTVIALMKDIPDMEGDKSEGVNSLSVQFGPRIVSGVCFTILTFMYVGIIFLGLIDSRISTLSMWTHLGGLMFLQGRSVGYPDGARDESIRSLAMHNYFQIVWPLFYYEFFAYLLPLGLEMIGIPIPIYVPATVVGALLAHLTLTGSRLTGFMPETVELVESSCGVNIDSLQINFRLPKHKSCFTVKNPNIRECAAEMSVALSMHAKLTRLSGSRYANARKLAILCGDWLMARAVVSLCRCKDQSVVHEMGKAIVTAASVEEKNIPNAIQLHANLADQSYDS